MRRLRPTREKKKVYTHCQKPGCKDLVDEKNGKYCSWNHSPHAGRYSDIESLKDRRLSLYHPIEPHPEEDPQDSQG